MIAAFAQPWLLGALLLLPVLGLFGSLAAYQRRRALALYGSRIVPTGSWRGVILWLGLSFLAVGMAGPRWGRDWNQSAAPGRDLMIVLDQSWSMFAEAPTRTHRAHQALLDLADSLARRGGHRVGLVVFAGSGRLVCPLTHDLDHFRDVVGTLDDLAPPPGLGGGTRIGAGLLAGLEALSGREQRDLLLVSDGDDPARDGEWLQGVERAVEASVPIHVLAIGDADKPHLVRFGGGWLTYQGKEVKTRLEMAPLRRIVSTTGGSLLDAGVRAASLGTFHEELSRRAVADSPDTLPVLHQRQGWFLAPAFLLLFLAAWRPN